MGFNAQLKKIASISPLFVLLVSLLLSSCGQQVEGCLDFRALSVDVGADDACADCCVFPSLELQFIPARLGVDTTIFLRASDTLVNGAMVARLPELGFYLHDIFLIAEDGERLQMQDTFTVFADGSSPDFLFESSVLRVSPFRQVRYNLGTLLEAKTFVAVEAKLGLPDVLTDARVGLQETGSPLFREVDSLLVSASGNSYLDLAFKFETLSGVRDSIELSDATDELVRWDLTSPIMYTPSYNLQIVFALPVDNMLEFSTSSLSGASFTTDVLEEARILEINITR